METQTNFLKKVKATTQTTIAILSLIWLSLILQGSQLPQISKLEVSGSCTATFIPSSTWETNHQDCEVIPNLTACNYAPTVTVQGNDCEPLQGDLDIGFIDVLDAGVLKYRYQVSLVNGSIVIVLVEEY